MRDQRLLEEVDVATNQKGLEAARRNISNIFFGALTMTHFNHGLFRIERIFTNLKFTRLSYLHNSFGNG